MGFEIISGLLRSSDYSIKKDKNTFERWERGEITINECYSEFMSNNGYRKSKHTNDYNTPWHVDKTLFKKWLHSLGYVRLVRDTEVLNNEE